LQTELQAFIKTQRCTQVGGAAAHFEKRDRSQICSSQFVGRVPYRFCAVLRIASRMNLPSFSSNSLV